MGGRCYSKRSAYLYVGLSTSVSTLDFLYLKVLQWVDGNIAYYLQVDEQSSSDTIPISVDFLSCAKESNCDARRYISACEIPGKGQVPMFQCYYNSQTIPYSLLCDYRSDCLDGSDERFCVFPACAESTCENKQCLSFNHRCDGVQHCLDRSDEEV
ncbi:hypothetical protein C0Q70_11778 [Pomacea canaliculata]|uniref:Uncharacterized protein n=1 Tax=Pomacea canaliculata TaxID=400727 RepID=A0A2T7P6Z9_POMCA|nr:hypothetical protein C0Q70_11778 [Pomacea canaliculata]